MRRWAGSLRGELQVLQLAAKDPRTPRAAKWLVAASIAYALSPIDLIPDSIPVLGQLDDLLLVPAGLWLARRMIPDELMAEFRREIASTRER